MKLFKSSHKKSEHKTRGMRITEGLLPIFGPANVGDSTAPIRPPSEEEVARDQEIVEQMQRKVAPDGRVYLVERS